jgi:AcrR family transcriptional regulator
LYPKQEGLQLILMSRPIGRRNADYAQERLNLIERLRPALLQPRGSELSFRELAAAAEVSPATLRHYFGTREQLIAEVLAELRRAGLPYLHAAATHPIEGVRASLEWLLRQVVMGWRMRVGAIHSLALAAGLEHDKLGPAYVNEVLEPTLQAAEARLARHVSTGELEQCDLRHAALELLSPLVLGLLHQQNLFGARCRPLDLEAFLQDHLSRFLRAYGRTR